MRPICDIARDIRSEWKKVYYGAVPYLNVMLEMVDIKGNYMYDSNRDIVLRFLSNAGTFRGGNAKTLKDELKAHLNTK